MVLPYLFASLTPSNLQNFHVKDHRGNPLFYQSKEGILEVRRWQEQKSLEEAPGMLIHHHQICSPFAFILELF
jgi:hypothetical protein